MVIDFCSLKPFAFGVVTCMAALLYSCGTTNEVSSQADLMEYVADEGHGLSITSETGGIETSCSLKPTDLLVLQELEASTMNVSVQEIKSGYEENLYFILSYSYEGGELVTAPNLSIEGYSDLVQIFSYGLAEYITLSTSTGKKIDLKYSAFQPTYGSGASSSLLLVFPRQDIHHEDWVQVNVREMGLGTGKLSFRYLVKDINDIPSLSNTVFSEYIAK